MSPTNSSIQLEIVSVQENLFSGKTAFVVVPGVDGELGIYPKHSPLLTQIKPGTLKFRAFESDKDSYFFVAGGFLEVQPNVVTVLADVAVRGEDLDEERAEGARKQAEEVLLNKKGDKISIASAQAELSYALAELSTIRKINNRG